MAFHKGSCIYSIMTTEKDVYQQAIEVFGADTEGRCRDQFVGHIHFLDYRDSKCRDGEVGNAWFSLLSLHDDPIVKSLQEYVVLDNELPTLPLQTFIALPAIIPSMFDSRDFLPPKRISPKDTETSKSPTPVSSSSSIRSSSPVGSTAPSPDYLFDESIFAKLDNSLWIISRLLGEEPDPEKFNEPDAYDCLWK
ncbi:hypothetical protein Tco_1483479 [Tanacetum coccineum]